MPERVNGQVTFGSERAPSSRVRVVTGAGSASGLALYDSAGVEYVLWVDDTGDLRIGTVANFETDPDTLGTVVGGQT